jgi:hypothetical protein
MMGETYDPEGIQSSESSKLFPNGVVASLNACSKGERSAGVRIIASMEGVVRVRVASCVWKLF